MCVSKPTAAIFRYQIKHMRVIVTHLKVMGKKLNKKGDAEPMLG